ncbi:ABC transporter substrate-binding protein [Agrobacterium vitis]|uniref:ABC transporter substrate-binding protein n=1 Tax=Agrobacterium vitis TaxID=373 RepID=UPI0018D226FB|nr:ABC transporter substrate-binding protein [Agrobacterium vitis]
MVSGSLLSSGKVLAAEKDGTLTLGFASETSSMDPHWHIVTANSSVAQHIFDRLVHLDETQNPVPALATEWKAIDDLTWEFKLREGAKFHNGDPVTPEDIIFSYQRAQNVPGAIFNMRAYLADKTFEKVDDRTVLVKTAKPNPIVPNELSTIAIISMKVGEGAITNDYNNGKATIGSGPYRFVEYVPGARVVLERNEEYWGEKPDWKRVVIQPIPVGGARVAAIQSLNTDVVDNIPPADIAHLEGASGVSLVKSVANRMVFLSMDQGRKTSPFVRGNDGSEIPNVFLDHRVRQAIDIAIDKTAIASRILEGNGAPAEQLVPKGIFGFNPAIALPKADTTKAKALLAEAGLPDGFKLTLHGPNDRFIRDAAVVQAVAQMLTRIGIKVEVETMPGNVFYKRASGGGPEGGSEFSFFLVGYGAATGEVSGALRNVIHTFDKESGLGSNNRTRYSNPEIDALIQEGMRTIDDAKRLAIYQDACAKAMAGIAIVPLYYPISVWGTAANLRFPGRSDERTLAMDFSIAN